MQADYEAELEKLKASLAGLEAQRSILGAEIVDPAINSLREKIQHLERQSTANGNPAPVEERRIVTIMFADVVGSTTLAERMDPEEWSSLITTVHQAAGKCILDNHGHILQYLGDGILAIFGMHHPNERDPMHAITAALCIQAMLTELTIAIPIQMRVGIHTGLVLLGDLNLPDRREISAFGDAMNTAARIQSHAAPGQVLISRDTYRYVRGLFEVIALEPVMMKGKRELVQTYQVMRALPSRFRTVNRGVTGIESDLIGRQSEFDLIRQSFEQAITSQQSAWVHISGPAGIGKSRLVVEFLKQFDSQLGAASLIKARAYQGDEQHAYAFLRKLYFNQFDILDSYPLNEAESRFVAGIKDLAASQSAGIFGPEAELEESAHALGLLTGLSFESSHYLPGKRHDPAQVKGQALILNRQLLASALARQPVILLLEDLHWIDGASQEFLLDGYQHSGGQAESRQGLFILSTSRPDWIPPDGLRQHAGFEPIQLEPLSRAATILLTSTLLSQADHLPDEVIDEIVDRSEGVPYYAEEIVNWLIDKGIIDTQSTPWTFDAAGWGKIPLPDTLQHLLTTRLSLVPEPEQKAVKCGSVFGRNFWENGITSLGAANSRDLLIQAEARGIVVPERSSKLPGEQEWRFYHNLLREAAYTSLLIRERKELHHAAAEWLETRARQSGRLDEFSSVLASHYDLASMNRQAAQWYLLAGRSANRRAAFTEARRYLDRALELVDPQDTQTKSQLLLERNEVLGILGETEARLADDLTLVELAHQLGDDHLLATAYQRLGHSKTKTWDQRGALQAFETAVAAARRANDTGVEAVTLSMIAFNQIRLGEQAAALSAIEQALALVNAFDDEISQAKVITNASAFFAEKGDIPRALELTLRQVHLTRNISSISGEALGLLNLGYFNLQLGNFPAGHDALLLALSQAERIGARPIIAQARLNLGLACWRLQKNTEAIQILQDLLAETESLGDVFGNAVCHTYLGLVYEQTGDYASAQAYYALACQGLRRLGMPGYLQDALAGMVRISLQSGELEAANDANRELSNYLSVENARGLEFPTLAYLTCARVFAALSMTKAQHAILQEGHRHLLQAAAMLPDEGLRQVYLNSVPEHQQLIQAYQQIQRDGG